MKASVHLFRQWTAQLRQLLPTVHGHRTKTLAFCVCGLVLSGKARLPLMAEELLRSRSATTPSSERRLTRFLANDQVAVVPIWASLLAHLLPGFRGNQLVVVLDTTRLDQRACVVSSSAAGPVAPGARGLASHAAAHDLGRTPVDQCRYVGGSRDRGARPGGVSPPGREWLGRQALGTALPSQRVALSASPLQPAYLPTCLREARWRLGGDERPGQRQGSVLVRPSPRRA